VVELSAFQIQQQEVTVESYQACVDAEGCESIPSHCETAADMENPDLAPITCVRHDQAEAYCAWVGGRLPTEAEWEKAARGEEGTPWAWGQAAPNCTTANFREITTYCELGVIEVGSYETSLSPYGLMDTVGNAWEWVSDFYDASYYRDAPDVDPQGPESCSLEVGGTRDICTHHVMRGGAFNTRQDASKGSARAFGSAELWDVNIGFRCAFSL
jgi:formylglycine-generating enzyme required for sulfatase activity